MGFFTGNRKREQRLAEAGVDGQATLVSFTEVGQQNFTPLVDLSLRITPADGNAAFDVTVRTQVEFSEIGKLEPGDVFAVRYDPADHNNFQLQGKIVSAGTATSGSPEQYSASELAAASQASGETGQKKSAAALLATGQRMTGVLREFAPSGHTVGDLDPSLPDPNDPVYVIKAELPISGSTPIETVFMNRVPQAKVATLQLGARVTLAVNPGNPTHEATIDWENSPVIAG